jgi:hypothetical protein
MELHGFFRHFCHGAQQGQDSYPVIGVKHLRELGTQELTATMGQQVRDGWTDLADAARAIQHHQQVSRAIIRALVPRRRLEPGLS